MALSATSDGLGTAAWRNILRPLLLRLSSDNVLLIGTHVRARVIAPILNAAVALSMVMSFMLLLEAVFMSSVSLYVKLFRRTPEKRFKCKAMGGDAEKGGLDYPMVLVQIPMYNEKEVIGFLTLSPLVIFSLLRRELTQILTF
jgi:hypothetical protein